MRCDKKRTFIINRNTFSNNSTYGWYSVLHPVHAIVFAFFSKNEEFNVVISKIAEFLSKTSEEVEKLITPFINNPEDVYVEHQGIRFEIPRNVLIESEENIKYHREYEIDDFIYEEDDFHTKRYFKAPLNMTFMPNNACVTNCIYCYCDKDHKVEKLLPYERLIEIMDEAKKLEMLNFGVVGGEVFTYPHWRELLKAIKDRDFELSMISTKVPITIDDIKYLKSLGIKSIQISIDSLVFEEMKILLNIKETYFTKIQETVKNLCKEGFNVQIATILTKYNTSKESMDSILKLINETGASSWSISPGFESLYRPQQSFRTDKDSYYQLFEYIESLKEKCNANINISKTFIERGYNEIEGGSQQFEGATCSALCSHIFVLPDGKVTMCEQLYWKPHFIVGDLTTQSITDVWNGERAKWFLNLKPEQLQPDNPCRKCDIFEKCYNNMNRCWADVVKAYGIENWDFPDPRCNLAPKMFNNLNY